MNFEKLDDYILELQNYQEGRYEYRTLTSEFDIKKAIENGKKIVFLKNKLGAKAYLILGCVFLVLGLILAIIFSVNILVFSMIFGIFGAFGIALIVTGLFKMRTSFLVLGPEGIVYKLQVGSIKGFKWEEISLDLGGIMSFSIQIHIVMPNGDFIKIAPGDYCSEEFPKSKSSVVFDLHMSTFMLHYRWGKFKLQEINLEEDKHQVKKDMSSAESTNKVNDYSLEDLRKEYYKYKEKKYKFGKYGTREQIRNEFLKGKVFVLKGGLRIGGWILTILMFGIALVSLFAIFHPDPNSGIFIIFPIFTFPTGLMMLLIRRNFLVIGPLGVYYRKILSSGVFSWKDVNNIKHFTQAYSGFNTGVVVKIYIYHGRKIRFGSNTYLNKEFPRKVEGEMFLTLFYIYSQRGQSEISQFIQKTVPYSQLNEELLSSHLKTQEKKCMHVWEYEKEETRDLEHIVHFKCKRCSDRKIKVNKIKKYKIWSKEFEVNDFLTLKLENDRTFIYIKGKRILQCIRLFLQIPSQEINLYKEVESIDEATELYKQSLYRNRIVEGPLAKPSRFKNDTITPEQEFWGHCSNVQAWVEHDYDTRILHSNLSFRLLKELTDAGDPKAKAIFQEEIALRFESGYFPVIAYLIEQRYLLFLDKDNIRTILENNLELEERFLENKDLLLGYGLLLIQIDNYTKAIKILKKSLKIDSNFIYTLFFIGIAHGIFGDHAKALQFFRKTIQIINSIGVFHQFVKVRFRHFELAWYGLVLSIIHLNEYKEIFNLFLSPLKSPMASIQIHKTISEVFKRKIEIYPKIFLELIESGYIRYMSEEELNDFLENVTELPFPHLKNEFSLTNHAFVNIIFGDFTKAKHLLKQVLSQKNLKHPELALCLLGIAYSNLNQHEKAQKSFRKESEVRKQSSLVKKINHSSHNQFFYPKKNKYDVIWPALSRIRYNLVKLKKESLK